ncbi:cyclin-like protein [Dichotomopilus funicola]|uniref:Cyclin-like protein n=1 Tax=Dichotomopilus funicola TaxID=1934379 RepID=A0AAN6UXZ0_9PEZI|nr:cyclin-like protein [Dichotomopilus funicola]
MATEDARYRQTSQFQLWSFSPTQLSAMRENTNTAARTRIADRLASLPPTAASASAAAANPNSASTSNANTPDPEGGLGGNGNGNGRSSTPALPEFLTAPEEAQLVTFFTSELLRAGDHAEMSDEIKATAATFFRRFYVTNSVMTYPPQEMLIVALFFGCKAEGSFVSISEFVKTFGRDDPESVLAGEFLLCQGLRFAIDVKHPFRALRGALMELAALPDIDLTRLGAAESRARDILRFSPLITDAYFHYTPSQIMMAALSLADRGLAEQLITKTFHHVAPAPDSGADTPMAGTEHSNPPGAKASHAEDQAHIIGFQIRDKILGAVEACRDMLGRELPERREHWTNKAVIKAQITPLRKKLNKCRDPERWNLVELQRARREQATRKGASGLDSDDGGGGGDLEDDRTLEGDEAVFGEPLGAGTGGNNTNNNLHNNNNKRRKVLGGGGAGGGKGLDDPFGGSL